MSDRRPLFLVGLALAALGATLILLGALDAWGRGAARLAEQLQPEHVSLFLVSAACMAVGAWLMRSHRA